MISHISVILPRGTGLKFFASPFFLRQDFRAPTSRLSCRLPLLPPSTSSLPIILFLSFLLFLTPGGLPHRQNNIAIPIPSSCFLALQNVSLRWNNFIRYWLRPRHSSSRSRIRIRTVRPSRRWSTTCSTPARMNPSFPPRISRPKLSASEFVTRS